MYPLITSEQRQAFLTLADDAQREAFAERLWIVWGDLYGFGGSFRRNYEERLEQCRNEFSSTVDDRARVLLIHGPRTPGRSVDCDSIFNPLEFWQWSRLEGLGQNVVILFYKPYGMGRFRLWDPAAEGRSVLYNFTGWSQLQAWLADPAARMYELSRPEYRCGNPRPRASARRRRVLAA